MIRSRLLSLVLIILSASCVDRIYFDTGITTVFPVVIEGFISDLPGPYEIRVTKSYDIESKQSIKTPLSVRRIIITDSQGNKEELAKISEGVYQTAYNGIQGKIGNAYSIKVDLLDGRTYESIPDTLYPSGTVEKVYFKFKKEVSSTGTSKYGFDVFFNSNAGSRKEYYYLWDVVNTFQVETNPELFEVPCGEARCVSPLPCSSGECYCCTCWVDSFNTIPTVSNNQFVTNGTFRDVNISYVPLNPWMFMHKVHAEVRQKSLSYQAYRFWKGVQTQKQAVSSLFQPVSGKIVGNFVQINGNPGPVEGLFYATSISSNAVFITRNDVPNGITIPNVELPFKDDCLKLFPNSTTYKPVYWD